MNNIIWFFVALSLTVLSCNKPSSQQLSSDKEITYFGFKTANNPALPANVDGSISHDTVKLILPASSSLNSLIPTISFRGKSVSPESNLAQNFSNPVSYIVTAEDGTTRSYVVIALLQSPGVTIFFNTSNGSASLNPSNYGYVYDVDANTGKIRWKYAPSGYDFSATPAFSNGILYAENYHKIIALDTLTKSIKWEYPLSNTVYAAIAVSNGIVYFNCNDSYLYALDAQTGSLKWRFAQDNDNPNDTDPPSCVSSPTIVNGVLYFGNSRSKYIYALDAATGNLKWKTFNSLPSSGKFESGPAVVNGIVYIADLSQNIIALNADNGSIKWYYPGNSGFSSSPTVVNGVLYIGGYGYLYAIDAITGNLKWKFPTPFDINVSPIVSKGVVYFGGGGGSGSQLYAVDASTGSQKWLYNYNVLTDVVSPVVFNDNVYFAVDYDFLALDVNTGKLKWKITLDGSHEEFHGAPFIVDEKGNTYYSSISGHQN